MRSMPCRMLLPTLLACLLLAAPAAAGGNLDLDEPGALVVLPVLTNDQAMATVAIVTNASAQPVLLALDFVSGDPGGGWGSLSKTCLVDAESQATFVIEGIGPRSSRAMVDCGLPPDRRTITMTLGFEQGLLIAAVADPASPPGAPQVRGQDVLLADAVIADLALGDAFAVGGIPFQAGYGQNNGDKVYRFDGLEYAHFPSSLATTTGGEAILFTLDGTLGSAPPARLSGDLGVAFSCFTIVPVGPGFRSFAPGLTAATDSHDAEFGDGNDTRRRAVHGWVITSSPFGGLGGRVLHQSTTALVPFGLDTVVLKAGEPTP